MDNSEAENVVERHGLRPMPIGCNEADAIRFLGCTENVFKDLRAAKLVKVLRRDWYSYHQLQEAMENMELRASAYQEAVTDKARKKQGSTPNFENLPIPERLSTRELLNLHEQRSIGDANKLK